MITKLPNDAYNATFHLKDTKLSRNAGIDIRIRTAINGMDNNEKSLEFCVDIID